MIFVLWSLSEFLQFLLAVTSAVCGGLLWVHWVTDASKTFEIIVVTKKKNSFLHKWGTFLLFLAIIVDDNNKIEGA